MSNKSRLTVLNGDRLGLCAISGRKKVHRFCTAGHSPLSYYPNVDATLLCFARANDAAASTTKKLAKQATLAAYLSALGDADLRRAVLYIAGRAFPATDERTLNIGGAIVTDVVLGILSIDPADYRTRVIRSGESGEAVAGLWSGRPGFVRASATVPLQLEELAGAFDRLAATGNVEAKKAVLRELLVRCDDPREAAYLIKVISGDLRTGVQEGVLQAAVAAAFGRPLADVHRAQLLLGNLDEVAVLARADALASAKFALFHPIQFMLATPQESADVAAATLDNRPFYAEHKLDGIRAQVHKQGDRLHIYTRTMDRTDDSFPDVAQNLRALPGDVLLDGEIVPYHDGIVLPFAAIQKRLGRKALTAKILRDYPAVFVAFDLLYRDGVLLMDEPLARRRDSLNELANATGLLTTAELTVTTADQIEHAFGLSRERRNEGLVLKDPRSPYLPGRRGKFWLKLKTHLPTLDCVVTAAEYGHGKRRNSLSDYTFAVWDRDPSEPDAALVNIGKAYSGVTDEEIAQLTELFLELSISDNGRVHRVKPQVVMEIAADQVQKSARHGSGYALRFPRIKRIRWDKAPAEADRLTAVAALFESVHNFGRGTVEPVAEPSLFDGL